MEKKFHYETPMNLVIDVPAPQSSRNSPTSDHTAVHVSNTGD